MQPGEYNGMKFFRLWETPERIDTVTCYGNTRVVIHDKVRIVKSIGSYKWGENGKQFRIQVRSFLPIKVENRAWENIPNSTMEIYLTEEQIERMCLETLEELKKIKG